MQNTYVYNNFEISPDISAIKFQLSFGIFKIWHPCTFYRIRWGSGYKWPTVRICQLGSNMYNLLWLSQQFPSWHRLPVGNHLKDSLSYEYLMHMSSLRMHLHFLPHVPPLYLPLLHHDFLLLMALFLIFLSIFTSPPVFFVNFAFSHADFTF